jgi:tetratricopeptide (TPR) repeat protein
MSQTDKQTTPPAPAGKGKAFFDRGDQVASTGNWDFAIQMYLDGLRREPENVARGHKPLRDVALKRKAQGGKPAGMVEQLKAGLTGVAKDPVEAMVNAEYMMAKDPGSLQNQVAVFKAALKLGHAEFIKFIADIVTEAMKIAKHPNKQLILQLTDAYAGIEEYPRAIMVADIGLKAFPDDGALLDAYRNYGAKDTIKAGKYGTDAGFTESVKDLKGQLEQSQRDKLSQGRGFIEAEIKRTRLDYEANPTIPGKVDALVESLTKIDEDATEAEAIAVLGKAYEQTKAYRFKVRMDDVKIRQLRRKFHALKAAGDNDAAIALAKETLEFELKVYEERAANYPTDLGIKFELGRRQLTAGLVDDAITNFQRAVQDAKRRTACLDYLGQAFMKKKWYREAVDNYTRALEFETTEDRAKDLHYNLAAALTAMDKKEEALKHLSVVVQLDYNFRDVREKMENLRKEMGQ